MTMVKRALIVGITGQDGSYLAEFLVNKGYEVHGIIRRASNFNTQRIDHLYVDPHVAGARLFLHYGELVDGSRMAVLLSTIRPHEVYHLAAQSHVRVSFDEPEYTAETTGLGTIQLLEAIRQTGLDCAFTRRPVRRCSVPRRRPRTRTRRFTRAHRTALRKFSRIGRPVISRSVWTVHRQWDLVQLRITAPR